MKAYWIAVYKDLDNLEKLKKIKFKFLPDFIYENKNQFNKWLED